MESIKNIINHITATPYHYNDSPERGTILHDTISDCACLVTNGDPIWYDSLAELNDELNEDAESYDIGATLPSLSDYVAYYCGVDLMVYDDDADILAVLDNELGYGATAWIKDIAANA